MTSHILLLGGSGILGRPVVRRLNERGRIVRILTRNAQRAQNMFGDTVELFKGTVMNRNDVRTALEGCDAVHVNLSPATEDAAMRQVIDLACS